MNRNVEQLTATINQHHRLRVWSVIMTFFGDAIVPRGSSVSARTVQELMARLGIEDGAVRTAFSRLTKDGWVVREKQGRRSFYQLSKQGLKPFAEATKQIYAPPITPHQNNADWVVAVNKNPALQPILEESPSRFALEQYKKEEFLLVSGKIEHAPEWIKALYAPDEAAEGYRHLMSVFADIGDCKLSDIDAMAVRCIIIHEWRRLLLRYKRVPLQLRPDDWPEDECLVLVAKLYHHLLSGSEAWLDEHATRADGTLPPTNIDLGKRFN